MTLRAVFVRRSTGRTDKDGGLREGGRQDVESGLYLDSQGTVFDMNHRQKEQRMMINIEKKKKKKGGVIKL